MSDKLTEAIAAVRRAYYKETGPDCLHLLYALATLKAVREKKQKRTKVKTNEGGV